QGELVESGAMSVLSKKYESYKNKVTCIEDNEQIKKRILTLQTFSYIINVSHTYHFTVNNLNKFRRVLFQAALEQDWSITTFHINQAYLEDMFMKAVKA